MVVTGDLALAQGLDDGEYGFALGGVDSLSVQVHGHVSLFQWLDIELSV